MYLTKNLSKVKPKFKSKPLDKSIKYKETRWMEGGAVLPWNGLCEWRT